MLSGLCESNSTFVSSNKVTQINEMSKTLNHDLKQLKVSKQVYKVNKTHIKWATAKKDKGLPS